LGAALVIDTNIRVRGQTTKVLGECLDSSSSSSSSKQPLA
jgi:hypothetical protein